MAMFHGSYNGFVSPLTTLERLELISVHFYKYWYDFDLVHLTRILPNLKIFCIRRKELSATE